jgi:hypothetical protein
MTEPVSLRAFCLEHSRDPEDVVRQLLADGTAVQLNGDVAARLAGQWAADDELRSSAEKRRRLREQGEKLRERVDSVARDMEFTARAIEWAGGEQLVELEARQAAEQRELEAAALALTEWERAHPEMADAIEAADGPAQAVEPGAPAIASPSQLRGWEKPNWTELSLSGGR